MKLFRTSFLLPCWEVWLTAMPSSGSAGKYQEFLFWEQNVLAEADLRIWLAMAFGVGVYFMTEVRIPVLLYGGLLSSVMVFMHS